VRVWGIPSYQQADVDIEPPNFNKGEVF